MPGTLYVIAAPSGAGKTSLVQRVLDELPWVSVSVSHTTRPPRPGEIDGRDYHFVDHARFEQLIAQDRFLEHARVFDHYYGTSRDEVRSRLAEDSDVILEIDWQGAQQVRRRFPDCQGVFILPPSLETLSDRLRGRGQDDSAVIERRMREAVDQMRHYDEFDYLIINDDFETSGHALCAIFVANRQRRQIQTQRHGQLLAELLS